MTAKQAARRRAAILKTILVRALAVGGIVLIAAVEGFLGLFWGYR